MSMINANVSVNAFHDRQVKIMNHWADVAPLKGVDIDDKLDAVMGRSICSELFCYEYILYSHVSVKLDAVMS